MPRLDREIIILAFAYHGGEVVRSAAPIVARVMQAYFELKVDRSLVRRLGEEAKNPAKTSCYNLAIVNRGHIIV